MIKGNITLKSWGSVLRIAKPAAVFSSRVWIAAKMNKPSEDRLICAVVCTTSKVWVPCPPIFGVERTRTFELILYLSCLINRQWWKIYGRDSRKDTPIWMRLCLHMNAKVPSSYISFQCLFYIICYDYFVVSSSFWVVACFCFGFWRMKSAEGSLIYPRPLTTKEMVNIEGICP